MSGLILNLLKGCARELLMSVLDRLVWTLGLCPLDIGAGMHPHAAFSASSYLSSNRFSIGHVAFR